jgi:hypothetical protein
MRLQLQEELSAKTRASLFSPLQHQRGLLQCYTPRVVPCAVGSEGCTHAVCSSGDAPTSNIQQRTVRKESELRSSWYACSLCFLICKSTVINQCKIRDLNLKLFSSSRTVSMISASCATSSDTSNAKSAEKTVFDVVRISREENVK